MASVECPHLRYVAPDVSDLDAYVAHYVGIYATKFVSENDANCPPADIASRNQRLMTQEHIHMYGSFADTFPLLELTEAKVEKYLHDYAMRMMVVPEVYGRNGDAVPESYFVVGNNRTYDSIKAEVFARFGAESVGAHFSAVIDTYIQECQLEPWVAARFAIRLLQKTLPFFVGQVRTSPDFEEPITSDMVIAEFIQSTILADNIALIKEGLKTGKRQEAVFNDHLRSLQVEENDVPLKLPIERADLDSFALINHVMERPYTAAELQKAQELLDTNPALQKALMIFQRQLIKFFRQYLLDHPERLAHTFEHYSEIFIPVEENQNLVFAPNPKLLKIISRNVMPAVARHYMQSGADRLLPEHLGAGAQTAKDLKLFQTIIGEFRTYEEGIAFDGLIAQMCPAMQPFSAALVEVLPEIFAQVESLQEGKRI